MKGIFLAHHLGIIYGVRTIRYNIYRTHFLKISIDKK